MKQLICTLMTVLLAPTAGAETVANPGPAVGRPLDIRPQAQAVACSRCNSMRAMAQQLRQLRLDNAKDFDTGANLVPRVNEHLRAIRDTANPSLVSTEEIEVATELVSESLLYDQETEGASILRRILMRDEAFAKGYNNVVNRFRNEGFCKRRLLVTSLAGRGCTWGSQEDRRICAQDRRDANTFDYEKCLTERAALNQPRLLRQQNSNRQPAARGSQPDTMPPAGS